MSEAPASLDEGLALLEEQREAMLARDADRLEAANSRLSAWIAGCRRGAEGFAAGRAGSVRAEEAGRSEEAVRAGGAMRAGGGPQALPEQAYALRLALDTNAALARRCALQASRALDALGAPESRTYTDEGVTRAAAARRSDTYSA